MARKLTHQLGRIWKRQLGLVRLRLAGLDPVVIIMVDGGLCSVMTKYVVGECFRKRGIRVKYDLSWFAAGGRSCDNVHVRHFTFTSLFPRAEMEEANAEEIALYRKFFRVENKTPYLVNDVVWNGIGPMYFDGYCENWRYFRAVESSCIDTLDLSALALNEANAAMLKKIEESEVSIAVQVRRGDYVGLGLSFLLPEYYLSAISWIRSRVHGTATVFFFSDDIDWVRNQVVGRLDAGIRSVCVDINDVQSGHFDLFLISRCSHQIASNSSFGYWGALLNRNPHKLVVIPKEWIPHAARHPHLVGSDTAHDYPGFVRL